MGDNEKHAHFKLKIAVSGAAETEHCGDGALEAALELGKEIVRQGAILVTGATTGIPFWAAKGAKAAGGISIGMSPAGSEKEHVEHYKLPLDYMDLIIYTGFGFSGRDILMTRSTDAVIFGCGRVGTIHEFTVAFEDDKPMGVLKGPWFTDEIIAEIMEKGHRKSEKIFFDENSALLVQKIIEMAKKEKKEYFKVYNNADGFADLCVGDNCKVAF